MGRILGEKSQFLLLLTFKHHLFVKIDILGVGTRFQFWTLNCFSYFNLRACCRYESYEDILTRLVILTREFSRDMMKGFLSEV